MDLLSKRYADPCFFLNGMIQTGRFDEFVENFIQTINQETEFENKEKEMRFHWEFFLHRVMGKSFKEYMDEIKNDENNQDLSKEAIETTIQDSMDILKKFNPKQKGGE